MRTLHQYLIRQVLGALLMTVLVFTLVLLLGNILREILAMLVNRQATLLHAGQAVALLIPFVLAFALPMGLLTATLLVFGRFSADQELTAVRASGVSLLALISPILLLSVALSGVSAAVNLYVAPQCRVAYKNLVRTVGVRQVRLLLPEKTFIKDFPNRVVYIGKKTGDQLKDILIYNLDKEGKVDNYIRAAAGHLQTEPGSDVIQVQLLEAWRVGLVDGRRTPIFAEESLLPYTNQTTTAKLEKRLTDMTFFELRAQLAELEKQLSLSAPAAQLSPAQLRRRLDALRAQRADLTLPIKVQMHRQVAFSFASIAFTLVGIPLGIRAHRRETTFGMAVALLLVLGYYSFFILGQTLDARPECFPQLILWAPNFLF